MRHLEVVILGLFLFASPLHGFWKLAMRKNTYVVDISESNPVEMVDLNYLTPENENIVLSGQSNQRIEVREEPDVGDFTYVSKSGTQIDVVTLLINNNKGSLLSSKPPIHCEAKNYSGYFSCWWTSSHHFVHTQFHAKRGQNNITCERHVKQNSVYSVQCHDSQTCEYEEEQQQIQVQLQLTTHTRYENHTSMFVLRDITKPDPPMNLHYSMGILKWNYPKSWCNVHSYFPLVFNVKYNITNRRGIHQHHEKTEHTNLTYKSHKSPDNLDFCVQARDMYYNSSWSEWKCLIA